MLKHTKIEDQVALIIDEFSASETQCCSKTVFAVYKSDIVYTWLRPQGDLYWEILD
jgi:hypothetical protein